MTVGSKLLAKIRHDVVIVKAFSRIFSERAWKLTVTFLQKPVGHFQSVTELVMQVHDALSMMLYRLAQFAPFTLQFALPNLAQKNVSCL